MRTTSIGDSDQTIVRRILVGRDGLGLAATERFRAGVEHVGERAGRGAEDPQRPDHRGCEHPDQLAAQFFDRRHGREGFDIAMIQAVRAQVSIPLVASGGAGAVEHFVPPVAAGADAVLAASVFHFGDLTVGQVKNALAGAGHPVR